MANGDLPNLSWWQWALGGLGALGFAVAEGWRRGKKGREQAAVEAVEASGERFAGEHERTRAEVRALIELMREERREFTDLIREEGTENRKILREAMERMTVSIGALDKGVGILLERSRGRP